MYVHVYDFKSFCARQQCSTLLTCDPLTKQSVPVLNSGEMTVLLKFAREPVNF